jgi:hypothetical protein
MNFKYFEDTDTALLEFFFIVPTLRVGTQLLTLQRHPATLERCRMNSHAKRRNYVQQSK